VDGCTWYVVKAGDSLGVIAANYHTTVQAIAARNQIANPNHIYVGQKLCIPTKEVAVPYDKQPAAPADGVIMLRRPSLATQRTRRPPRRRRLLCPPAQPSDAASAPAARLTALLCPPAQPGDATSAPPAPADGGYYGRRPNLATEGQPLPQSKRQPPLRLRLLKLLHQRLPPQHVSRTAR